MKYKEKILEGFFIKRYKRFFVDAVLDGNVITTYCPNTGSLRGMLNENAKVLIAKVDNPKAKLKYRLEAIKHNGVYVGINTSLPNGIIFEAIKQKKILDNLQGEIKKEVKYGKNSRVDIFINNPKGKDCFIEVKSVTLSRVKGLAEFPDAKTTRGSKHLIELGEMSKQGHDCYLVYLIQRKDINIFSIAKDIDEEYYKNSIIAKKSGVKFIAFSCEVSKKGIDVIQQIKINEN
jgi:sugar fermentation stimulation protein A|tara:strand:+ start:392 stop:1090 length:699 start_codon:yes stop_codon:yes gene_type:complete